MKTEQRQTSCAEQKTLKSFSLWTTGKKKLLNEKRMDSCIYQAYISNESAKSQVSMDLFSAHSKQLENLALLLGRRGAQGQGLRQASKTATALSSGTCPRKAGE